MKTISTFNAFHLGDNLVTLHWLRGLAKAYPDIVFSHACEPRHLVQLAPLTADLPNLIVGQFDGPDPVDTWFGRGGYWYAQPDTANWVAPALRHFQNLTELLGFSASANPLKTPADFLFDYSALAVGPSLVDAPPYDVLIVNSPPQSGQWSGFNLEGFDRLCARLDDAGLNCITTHPSTHPDTPCTVARKLDVTGIGKLAQSVRCIIGCVTGPMWPTLNIWNRTSVALRVHLLDRERVEILPDTTVHANSLSLVPEILKDRGLL